MWKWNLSFSVVSDTLLVCCILGTYSCSESIFGPSFCKIYFTAKSYLAGLSFFLQSHGYQYMYVIPLITQYWQKYWVLSNLTKSLYERHLFGAFSLAYFGMFSWWKTLTRYRSVEKMLQISVSYIDSDMINLFLRYPQTDQFD